MNEQKLLTSALHIVQMGQNGIRSVMDDAVSPALKQEMKTQLTQYDAMEKEVLLLAKQKGLPLKNLHPGVQIMADMMSKMRLLGGQRDSKIAGMLIQGNTRGMILGTKNLHHCPNADTDVLELTQRLVAQEQSSIKKAQRYL